MKTSILLITLMLSLSIQAQDEDKATESLDMETVQKAIDSIANTFSYQYNTIELNEGMATLHVPDGYKFLDAQQSKRVLTDLWGNPPSETLGLLFPKDMNPMSDDFSYAVELSYSEEGFIDDSDAKEIDYDELLTDMQNEAHSDNAERMKQGYESVELIGWASPPYYDSENKKLHWAKELKFGESQDHTLNYNIRVLGRRGYLVLNAIGDINVLPVVKSDINNILASVNFNEGHRYDDFNPDFDEVAAYGIGGLIAGKVLAKVGFFAVLLKFWKIIGVGIIGGFSMLRKKIIGNKKKISES